MIDVKAMPTLRVLLPVPVGAGYDYLVPEGLAIKIGQFVRVPLGSKEEIGVVWGQGTGQVAPEKLKPIKEVLDLPPMPASTCAFMDWVASYTLTPPGALLKMAYGGALRLLKPKDQIEEALLSFAGVPLSDEQERAALQLTKAVQDDGFAVHLLDGVTGSGKTEVYARALAQCFQNGRQALVLLPEIAMTAALLNRFEQRFGVTPTLWHSALSEKQRRLNWHAILQGKARFILGARSALFLPYRDLGLIVVDEEHEGAYKQEEGVIYHGRDMAVVRARIGKMPLILASATPSLESLYNVEAGKYWHLVLPHRFAQAQMPEIKLVDLRQQNMSAEQFISPPLKDALEKTFAQGAQAMLFLNRRGYAPLTLCRACGFRFQCPSCTSWLIEHKRTARLHCHQCGYSTARTEMCPSCKVEGKLAACGPGIERVAQEAVALFPKARFAMMASDMMQKPQDAIALIQKMEEHELDLLIGTQIMAKGYHFPRLTLVGVIDADLGLGGGDPRAAERTYQLLQQVAGRAGRAEHAGSVFLQTTNPEHPVMQALVQGQRESFIKAELQERKNWHLPPFGRLASLVIAGADAKLVMQTAAALARAAPPHDNLRLLGPAPAPLMLLRGKTRYRLTVQAARSMNLGAWMRDWLSKVAIPRQIRIHIDVDPYSFL
ncbi:MAG: primosomal protein N' [Alphaproteobacteria bacterium]|nr:primosomal protein N' [Alphaproteobacteria bacterium]